MPDSDLTIELLHDDPDGYRLEVPIRTGRAAVTALEPLTHDNTRLDLRVIEPADFAFKPGQYVICTSPAATSDARSREFVPVLSEPGPDDAWDGETGFVHEVLARYLQRSGANEREAYMCGPPPPIEAAIELLVDGHGLDDGRVHYDKFTTAADAGSPQD
jgi:NAD(P)H-flavin reductase